MYKVLMTVILAGSILSCGRKPDSVGIAMELAGDHAGELQRLIDQFPDSSCERMAAEFLIANMPGHYSLKGEELKKYREYFKAYGVSTSKASAVSDSLENIYGKFNSARLTPVADITAISCEYLSEEIREAIRIWEAYPWAQKIPFGQFAEYILPYRIGNEELGENWHGAINMELSPVLDSLRTAGCIDPIEVAKSIINWWDAPHFKWTGQLPVGINVGPQLRYFHCGSCMEMADAITYLLRGAGVASAIDYEILRGDANASHFRNVAFDENGTTYALTPDYRFWVPTDKYPLVTSKVYRIVYSSLKSQFRDVKDIPQKLRNANMVDVTSDYGTTYTLDVKLAHPNDNKHALLCNSSQLMWEPVAAGEIKKGRALFRNVRPGAVTIVGCLRNGALVPQSPPFQVIDSKRIRYFIPKDKWYDAEIYCKFPLSEKNGDVVGRVVGGEIQGSDHRDFKVYDNLLTITEFPKRKLNEFQLHTTKPYRYYRYIGADSTYCNIAEVMLLDENGINIALEGSPYGTEGSNYSDRSHDYRAVFDGDWFTSFDYPEPSGGWSAVDMGQPRKIERVIYSPRNRDNYVRPGNLYELFYWSVKDSGWISLGEQRTETDYLKYKVPAGALLYLKNHTNGQDERIFEYDCSKQEQIFY
ncbi:MAG: discoidin domain-containing protein [Muribaculaceae bacterium]|nr:discoidin domain-containing protein [Muribaculaceae bacterium]